MKKIVLQILICSIACLTNLSLDGYPFIKDFTKKRICKIKIDSILSSKKLINYRALLSDKEIDQIKRHQKEHCKKQPKDYELIH